MNLICMYLSHQGPAFNKSGQMTPPKPPRKNPPKPEIAITHAPPNVDSGSVVIRVKYFTT